MSPVWALAFVALVCATAAHSAGANSVPTHLWRDLRVKYSHEGAQKGFYQMPRTVADAKTKGLVHLKEELATDVDVYCFPNDPTVCLVYGKKGFIVGIQIAVQKKGLVKAGYPFNKHHSFVPKKRFGHDVYVTTLFFVPQAVLKSGGRASLADHGTGSGLWLQDGADRTKMMEIPRFEKDLGKTLFKKQACMNGMGYHYYYNMSDKLHCEDFFPIFGLYKNGEMVGFGFQTFGKQTPVDKTWFETFPATAFKNSVIPHPPQCLVDRISANELISLHVYFVEKPWDIKC